MSEKNYVVNVKTGVGTIITVRGDSPAELADNINGMVANGLNGHVSALEELFHGAPTMNSAVATVQAAFPGAQVISETPRVAPSAPAPQASAGGSPVCKHGPMQWVDGAKFGKSWKGYFCPQPKDAVDKCAPQFQKG